MAEEPLEKRRKCFRIGSNIPDEASKDNQVLMLYPFDYNSYGF